MDILRKIVLSYWHILMELSVWLLLGMLIAGLLHVLLPYGFIRRHLGKRRLASVFKAVAVGVPMPLCSCGVIPAAVGLKKEGASDGAAIGFLISTPQTGVDSILVSATFLGWPFAVFKVFSAFISGLIGGLLVNIFGRDTDHSLPPSSCPCPQVAPSTSPSSCQTPLNHSFYRSCREGLRFCFLQLLHDIYLWLIIGITLAAIIDVFISPGSLVRITWTQGFWGMLTMLIISLPMYICATASVPLAASLVIAGMSPGSALVLLMAGPTTNLATIGAVYRTFGARISFLYLAAVAVLSVGMGLIFDWILSDLPPAAGHMHALPVWLSAAAATLLLAIFACLAGRDIYVMLRRKK